MNWACIYVWNRRCGRMGRNSVHCTCTNLFRPLRLLRFLNNHYFVSGVLFIFVVCFRLYSRGTCSGVVWIERVCVFYNIYYSNNVCRTYKISVWLFLFQYSGWTPQNRHIRVYQQVPVKLRVQNRFETIISFMKWHWMTSKCKSRIYVAAGLTPFWSAFLIQSFYISNCTVRCYMHKSHPVPKACSW